MKVSLDNSADIKTLEIPTNKVLSKQYSGEYNIPSSLISEMTDESGHPTDQAFQTAVNKLNEFMEYHQKNSKFVFHQDLNRYYVQVVDAQTEEVIKEIPPKELLDAYFEMQKLVGKLFDKKA
ncbi:flagellar protein FlaG [Rummeliibacillus pycnus]|uniref:flagellar protein FlaG n=1 Tax=Rummeliibacillus pycnus TaxID=101070 RepID=UPI0037CC54E6